MWRPSKEDIGHWLEAKGHEFSINQNNNLQINLDKWLQRYVFIELHEIFFVDFFNVLDEWLQRLS